MQKQNKVVEYQLSADPVFFPDLTPEEQNVLINIRKRKLELLQEINQLREELTEVNTEIEAMDTEEGYELIIY